jgi:hypothetical protein
MEKLLHIPLRGLGTLGALVHRQISSLGPSTPNDLVLLGV